MKRAILLASIATMACMGCSSGDDKTADKAKSKDKYEQTKETLEETEKKNPRRFLSVSGHDKKNLWRQTVIKGTISNNAKVASYKDVDVELSFYSKTGALLEKDHEVIYETIAPGSKADFKTRYFAPKGTDSVALRIVAAKTE
ncbi:MAG: hypothetical protein KTQ13_07475 [Ferruginibacter sp.]|nr:hypothetical protein [Chitinophagaceae bacterium]MBP6287069.1 hypothetical protein [Ferruginibacter sp.]MBU9936472.1 hypothetical protein [Ferruginibacter sp.]HQY11979.1 hypothetical protein [Ferruginibacter sp.]